MTLETLRQNRIFKEAAETVDPLKLRANACERGRTGMRSPERQPISLDWVTADGCAAGGTVQLSSELRLL